MIIFLGFEGVLASKVTEDIQYEELLLVNNLPSFFPKYKDICVINNYDLLSTHRSKLLYVPANNPFETFNFLDSVFDGKSSLCVAPLSTKPVALGVCYMLCLIKRCASFILRRNITMITGLTKF